MKLAAGPPNALRQLPGDLVALNLTTPNPTMRVRDLDLRADWPGGLHAFARSRSGLGGYSFHAFDCTGIPHQHRAGSE